MVRKKNQLFESVYDRENKKAAFATSLNLNTDIVASISTKENETIIPALGSANSLLDKEFVKLASDIGESLETCVLLEQIRDYLHKYVDLDDDFEVVASHYVLMTWMFDRFDSIPYLRVIGDFGSGKSRFLSVIGSACYRPFFAGNTSTASIYRILDEAPYTIVIDEADIYKSDLRSETVKILNIGYQKNASVLRTEQTKDGYTPKAFSAFGPKILATREFFHDAALESRCLTGFMQKVKIRDDISHSLGDDFERDSDQLRNNLLRWRLDNFFCYAMEIKNRNAEHLSPRGRQLLHPLLVFSNEKYSSVLHSYFKNRDTQIQALRTEYYEYPIIVALASALEDEEEIAIGELANRVNESPDFDEIISARRMGQIARNKLCLHITKKSQANVINLKRNKSAIEFLCDRYGVVRKMD